MPRSDLGWAEVPAAEVIDLLEPIRQAGVQVLANRQSQRQEENHEEFLSKSGSTLPLSLLVRWFVEACQDSNGDEEKSALLLAIAIAFRGVASKRSLLGGETPDTPEGEQTTTQTTTPVTIHTHPEESGGRKQRLNDAEEEGVEETTTEENWLAMMQGLLSVLELPPEFSRLRDARMYGPGAESTLRCENDCAVFLILASELLHLLQMFLSPPLFEPATFLPLLQRRLLHSLFLMCARFSVATQYACESERLGDRVDLTVVEEVFPSNPPLWVTRDDCEKMCAVMRELGALWQCSGTVEAILAQVTDSSSVVRSAVEILRVKMRKGTKDDWKHNTGAPQELIGFLFALPDAAVAGHYGDFLPMTLTLLDDSMIENKVLGCRGLHRLLKCSPQLPDGHCVLLLHALERATAFRDLSLAKLLYPAIALLMIPSEEEKKGVREAAEAVFVKVLTEVEYLALSPTPEHVAIQQVVLPELGKCMLCLGQSLSGVLHKVLPLLLYLVEALDEAVRLRALQTLAVFVQALGERAEAHVGKMFEAVIRVCIIFPKDQPTQQLSSQVISLLHSLAPGYVDDLLFEVRDFGLQCLPARPK